MSFAERRWSEAQGKPKKRTTTERSPMVPTEKLCVAATAKRDAAAFDEMIARCHPLKPPGKRRAL